MIDSLAESLFLAFEEAAFNSFVHSILSVDGLPATCLSKGARISLHPFITLDRILYSPINDRNPFTFVGGATDESVEIRCFVADKSP